MLIVLVFLLLGYLTGHIKLVITFIIIGLASGIISAKNGWAPPRNPEKERREREKRERFWQYVAFRLLIK